MIISQDLIKTKDRSGKTAAREILLNTSSVSNNIRDKKVYQLESTIET
jgi:twitching motility protein PilT